MWNPCSIDWGIAERTPRSSFNAVSDLREVTIFEWFTMGWSHITLSEQDGNTLYQFADLRYGLDTNPKDSFFSLNVLDTQQGFEWSTENPIGNTGQINERFDNLFQSAYPNSCDRPFISNK